MKTSNPTEKLPGVVALLLIAAGCIWVLRPFLSPILWAAVISYATWPLYLRLVRALRGQRALAALLMVLLFAVVLVAPFWLVAANLAAGVSEGLRWLQALATEPDRPPPDWLARLPLVGGAAADGWVQMAGDMKHTLALVRGILADHSGWLLRRGLGLTEGLLQLTLSLFVAFFFFRGGHTVAAKVASVSRHIAGDRAERLVSVIGLTVKSTVYGILGTALAQGLLGYVGFLIAGIPSPLLLGLLTFLLGLIQVGAPLVWIPGAIWLFSCGRIGMGIFLAVWGFLVISGIDNFLKPYLLSKGANLPFLLVLFGVLGGLMAFGFIGSFIGPTVLAVGYSLIREWTDGAKREEPAAE